MNQRRKRHPCPTCGEPVETDTGQPGCPVCYWKATIRKIESDISFVSRSPDERRALILQRQEAVNQASHTLNESRSNYRSQQVWWRKLFGIYSKGDIVLRMERELSRLQSRLQESQQLFKEDSIRFLKTARRRLSVAKKELKKAQVEHDRRQIIDKLDKDSKMRFADQCRESLKLSFEKTQFRIRDQHFLSQNSLDELFLESFNPAILDTFDHRCVRCGSDRNLTLDHYGVTKREGGNFILSLKEDNTLKPNLTVLCRPCKRLRGEKDYPGFFSKEQIRKTRGFQARLLEEILLDPEVLLRIRKWYRGR